MSVEAFSEAIWTTSSDVVRTRCFSLLPRSSADAYWTPSFGNPWCWCIFFLNIHVLSLTTVPSCDCSCFCDFFPSFQWSFAVTLWEIYTLGRMPYEQIAPAEFESHLRAGNRLEQPLRCPNSVYVPLSWPAAQSWLHVCAQSSFVVRCVQSDACIDQR